MTEAGVSPSANLPSVPSEELMKRYGSLPLLHQPGEKWMYNSGSDILGVLISRVTGQTLETFLRKRIFEPLGMKDTGFSVPPEKVDRLPACYTTDLQPVRPSYSMKLAAAGSRAHPRLSPGLAGWSRRSMIFSPSA